ncbi:RDM1 [Mytilus coruscus]|uniref:RDM1 n=1 Tax=Mytilus coruscus TaxID=42192 RepID=A0A6J8EME8_MYTCO|nr:RDM1 [Mytilus coruscus]
MSCSVEIIDFKRPEGNRKNLYVNSIPGSSEEDVQEYLYSVFSVYGLINGIQIYSYSTSNQSVKVAGYYAFVTFYSVLAAHSAKESLSNKITIAGTECKIAYAKRKKDAQTVATLHFSKCQELANYYLGFNGWSTTIKLLVQKICNFIHSSLTAIACLIEDNEEDSSGNDLRKVRYVCVTRIDITGHHLNSEGMGAWEETYLVKDPTSKAKAICKSKKLAYQRSLENAFSKVILIVLPNGKVTVEVDTTQPDPVILTEKQLDDSNVLKVNELDELPDEDVEDVKDEVDEDVDAINLHILHELEEM